MTTVENDLVSAQSTRKFLLGLIVAGIALYFLITFIGSDRSIEFSIYKQTTSSVIGFGEVVVSVTNKRNQTIKVVAVDYGNSETAYVKNIPPGATVTGEDIYLLNPVPNSIRINEATVTMQDGSKDVIKFPYVK
jgi:hypothetical protein